MVVNLAQLRAMISNAVDSPKVEFDAMGTSQLALIFSSCNLILFGTN
jgi:hypothetical protein